MTDAEKLAAFRDRAAEYCGWPEWNNYRLVFSQDTNQWAVQWWGPNLPGPKRWYHHHVRTPHEAVCIIKCWMDEWLWEKHLAEVIRDPIYGDHGGYKDTCWWLARQWGRNFAGIIGTPLVKDRYTKFECQCLAVEKLGQETGKDGA